MRSYTSVSVAPERGRDSIDGRTCFSTPRARLFYVKVTLVVPPNPPQAVHLDERRGRPVNSSLMVGRTVPGRKFSVEVAGNTNGAHTAFVSQIKRSNYVETHSPQDSDFILVFCPVVSRVGTDIGEALQNLDPNKAKVLVVMHHTFNPNVALAESRRQVEDPNVLLTVDCLFFESDLLSCNRNDIAWDQFCRSLGIRSPQFFLLSSQSSLWERLTNCLKNNVWIVIAVLFATAVIFCWSLYGISLWIAIAVAFAGAVILFFCKTQFGINNNSVLAIALVFSGAVITLPGVLYSR